MLSFLKSWFKGRKLLEDKLEVKFDDGAVRVTVLAELGATWNQSFEWANIRRVCFKDGGLYGSDIVYVSLKVPDKVCAIPIEARGGSAFFRALCEKGYFPEKVWRRALGDTSGGLHCWPKD
jgi:hypothetical protein